MTCVPLVEWHKSSERSRRRHISGLLLVPCQEGDTQTYRRIGMFEDCWSGDKDRWKEGNSERMTII